MLLVTEQLDSEEMEDLEMNPLELDSIEAVQNSDTLMVKYEGSDTEVGGLPRSTSKRSTSSCTDVLTVTPLYKLPSTVDSQMAGNNHQIQSNDGPVLLIKDNDPSSVGRLRAEPLQLVRVEGNSYRFGKFWVERLGNSYKCLNCDKTFSGKNSAFHVRRHIRNIHQGEYRKGNSL